MTFSRYTGRASQPRPPRPEGSLPMPRRLVVLALCLAVAAPLPAAPRRPAPVVIAHRGASAYLPEHTLEAKAWAHATGADFIEQDVALTADGVPVILHDHYLDTVTDVAAIFPDRSRADGRFYAIDFTLAEIRTLRVHERIDLATGRAAYPRRFPVDAALSFRVPTLEEELTFIQGLNRSTGRTAGIYVELKAPRFHAAEGRDIAAVVLPILTRFGYSSRRDPCYLQCFDPDCLRRIRHVLRSDLKLVQLVADDSWDETPGVTYAPMLTPAGLAKVATYADGLGPWNDQLVTLDPRTRRPVSTGVVEAAHGAGLVVHPYTVRSDALTEGFADAETLMSFLVRDLGVDGFFTDFPDRGVAFVRSMGRRRRRT